MWLCFFFQAEDGIRDLTVTGVQTCALPISSTVPTSTRSGRARSSGAIATRGRPWPRSPRTPRARKRCSSRARSEERRVGKECRSRRAPYHEKKKHVGYQHTVTAGSGMVHRANDHPPFEIECGCVFFFKQKTAYEI